LCVECRKLIKGCGKWGICCWWCWKKSRVVKGQKLFHRSMLTQYGALKQSVCYFIVLYCESRNSGRIHFILFIYFVHTKFSWIKFILKSLHSILYTVCHKLMFSNMLLLTLKLMTYFMNSDMNTSRTRN